MSIGAAILTRVLPLDMAIVDSQGAATFVRNHSYRGIKVQAIRTLISIAISPVALLSTLISTSAATMEEAAEMVGHLSGNAEGIVQVCPQFIVDQEGLNATILATKPMSLNQVAPGGSHRAQFEVGRQKGIALMRATADVSDKNLFCSMSYEKLGPSGPKLIAMASEQARINKAVEAQKQQSAQIAIESSQPPCPAPLLCTADLAALQDFFRRRRAHT